MRDVCWLKDSEPFGRRRYKDDFRYNVTKEIYRKNPFVRITDLYIDNDDFLYVYYEFLVGTSNLLDVKSGEKIEDKELRKQVEIDIKEAVKNHTY